MVLAVINCVESDEMVFLFVLLEKDEAAGGFGGSLLEGGVGGRNVAAYDSF